MNQFFSATQVHLDDRCLIDAAENAQTSVIATLGTDSMIYRLNIGDGTEERFNLEHEISYNAMALAPDATHCYVGGNNTLIRFNFADSTTTQVLETVGNIIAIKYAPSGDYIAIGSEEGKCIVYDPKTEQKEKCRPGHQGDIYSIALSKSGLYLATIGKDKNVLINKIVMGDKPQEVARYTITNLQNCSDLTSSFHFNEQALFVAGSSQLQKLDLIESRWEYSKSNSIMHTSEIIMAQVVKANTLATSSYHEVCIWSIRQEEKLFEIQQISLLRVVPIANKFYGTRNDGKIYEYKREIKEEELMDIEHESANDRIEFDEEQVEQDENKEVEEEEERREIEYNQHKKSKADKMITCFPQPMITTSTQFFNDSRFVFVNLNGCVIERQEGDEQKLYQIELEGTLNKRQQRFTLPRDKIYSHFALNEAGAVYANEKQCGFKPSMQTNNEEQMFEWNGIEAVAMGSGWLAVANESEIKILDLAFHEIRSIAFDRLFVAMRAFQNVLAVVYHESVPLWGSQQLAMQLFLINGNRGQVNIVSNTHVPLTTGSLLRWFDFSREGMLFSQDTTGLIRAFSLETSQWTPIYAEDVEEGSKLWVIGIKNFTLQYWKTNSTDPQPTVAPRFEIKSSQFSIITVGSHPEQTQQTYQKLLWTRYILDHEKARTRLWGHLKLNRSPNNLYYNLSESILNEKAIAKKHIQLDEKYFSLVGKYLKKKETIRALLMAQNCIRSQESARKLVELFDFENQRSLAIQYEQHCDERQKEVDYEQMQVFQFIKLREEAEKNIKIRSEDPMKRSATRKPVESIPSFSQSFMMSQDSIDHSHEKLNNSKISQNSQNIQTENPFLKRKSNHESFEAKKKEINDQIQKFGIKQKADKRNIQKNISK